ncbi:MAG: hypothetical protein ACREPZ_05485, partial [Rhodanobacteraceae bacterium]
MHEIERLDGILIAMQERVFMASPNAEPALCGASRDWACMAGSACAYSPEFKYQVARLFCAVALSGSSCTASRVFASACLQHQRVIQMCGGIAGVEFDRVLVTRP